MVRNYKKKGNKRVYTQEAMESAVNAVMNKSMGYYKASLVYGVPQTTVERNVKKQKSTPPERQAKTLDRFKPKCVFNTIQENQLVSYLKNMNQHLFGLTSKDVRSLAYQLASRNAQNHRFNRHDQLAGTDWLFSFQKRHPELCLRRAAGGTYPSTSTTVGLSKATVDKFYDFLVELDSRGFTADRIFNADEVGITVNPNNRSRVKKARRQFQDKGCVVTAEICFSASGTFMPPMLVFPSDASYEDVKEGLPAGSLVQFHESGCVTRSLFMEWLKKFVVFSGASKESPVLLIVDGLSPHIKYLDIVDYADEEGVIFLCFPPHSLSRLQPIDVSFVKTLSLHYEEEVRLWLQTHPGQMITSLQFSPLFGSAYRYAATESTAIDGFTKTGVWPVVRLPVFDEEDFLSAEDDYESSVDDLSMHDAHVLTPHLRLREYNPEGMNCAVFESEGEGLPFRRRRQLPILKSRSYALKALKKTNEGCTTGKKDCEEKKLSATSSKCDSSPLSGDSRDSDDPQCLFCNDYYSKATEGWWIRCSRCERWAHHSCAGYEDEDDRVSDLICPACN